MKIVILLLYNESDNRQEQKVNMISSLWRGRERDNSVSKVCMNADKTKQKEFSP